MISSNRRWITLFGWMIQLLKINICCPNRHRPLRYFRVRPSFQFFRKVNFRFQSGWRPWGGAGPSSGSSTVSEREVLAGPTPEIQWCNNGFSLNIYSISNNSAISKFWNLRWNCNFYRTLYFLGTNKNWEVKKGFQTLKTFIIN